MAKKIGHILLADLKPNDIKAFREELRSKLSDTTINRYVASLSAALTYAAKELGWIERNPCLQIKKFKEATSIITIGINHPKYGHMAALAVETQNELALDFIE